MKIFNETLLKEYFDCPNSIYFFKFFLNIFEEIKYFDDKS